MPTPPPPTSASSAGHVSPRPAREPRNRRSELVLIVGWALVLLKCVAVWWACRHFPEIKVGAGWVIVPTLLFASLCTWIYWRRD